MNLWVVSVWGLRSRGNAPRTHGSFLSCPLSAGTEDGDRREAEEAKVVTWRWPHGKARLGEDCHCQQHHCVCWRCGRGAEGTILDQANKNRAMETGTLIFTSVPLPSLCLCPTLCGTLRARAPVVILPLWPLTLHPQGSVTTSYFCR